ncbi:MAG: hypothetical protein JNJ57_18960 [Saprospiraceae bacterium]|nr:hypothetical protein [Saprospiraceae bacterium]
MKQQSELRTLLQLMSLGFLLNFLCGLGGAFFEPESMEQVVAWQFGDTSAIMASILASRYIGSRNEHLAAGGFTLLCITYGISFASSSFNAVNEEKMATILLPLAPSMLLVSFCTLFPIWLRIGSGMVCIPFFFIYNHVFKQTYQPDDWSNYIGYSSIQLLGIVWSIFLWKDFAKVQREAKQPLS